MRVVQYHDYATLVATGAEVDALYRVYLAEFGPRDWATRDAFQDAVNRRDHSEDVDAYDARTVGDALARHGLVRTARHLWAVTAAVQAAELRDEADALEAQAEALEVRVWMRS